MTRALVLGGAGFVGLHLSQRLVAEGRRVTVVDDFSRGRDDAQVAALRADPAVEIVSGDLTDARTWAALPRGYDQIYLLAAVVGVRNVEADPFRVVRVNTLTTMHALDWITPEDRIFFSSTSEVYAGAVDAGVAGVPTAEDAPAMIRDVTSPRFAYATSKLLGEVAFVHATRAGRCRAVVGRFHNVYGPRMGTDHVVPEMALRALAGEDPFRVWGAEQSRAFCHVDDAVRATIDLAACDEAVGQVVHIGNDAEQTNITDLAKLILRLTGVDARLRALPAPPGSVERRCPDIGKLRSLTGFQPLVSVEEGVRRTVDWYRGWSGHSRADGPGGGAPDPSSADRAYRVAGTGR